MKLTGLLLTLRACSTLIHSANAAFDGREETIDSVHDALFAGITTCREVVSTYIARIEAFNPTVNAIISLNSNALRHADEKDLQIASGNATGTLLCIPVLLKDNYNTAEMNTTGGCLDLAGSQPSKDAAVVVALKNAGAIILGKTNLHELALEGLSVSSVGGQTVNPYDHTRTPGGSSGGTGAAIASNFAVFGTGTDTVNSLRSPASANSLFSIHPTRGLISRNGIMPISFTQDVIGPMCRNVKDVATALTVMASAAYDEADNATASIPNSSLGKDYRASLFGGSLKGIRFGLLNGFVNYTASSETSPVIAAMSATISALKSAGAIVMDINETVYNAPQLSSMLDVQVWEYRQLMDRYLSDPSLGGEHPSTLSDIYSSGKFVVIPSQYNFVKTSLVSSTSNATYAATKLGIQNLTTTLQATFTANNLDAIIYPEQKNLVVKIGAPAQAGRNGILAALTGVPVVTVPIGFSPPSQDAPIGVPIGMEILGLPWSEGKLLNIAAHFEALKHIRQMPRSVNGTVEVGYYTAVPSIVPNIGNIPKAYPLGTL